PAAVVPTGMDRSLNLLCFGYTSALLVFGFLRRGVVHLHRSLRLERAQSFITAGNDLVAGFQSVLDLDISDARDSCLNRREHGLLAAHQKHALHLILFLIARGGARRRGQGPATSAVLLRPS